MHGDTVGIRTMWEAFVCTSVFHNTYVPGARRVGSESGWPGGSRMPRPMVRTLQPGKGANKEMKLNGSKISFQSGSKRPCAEQVELTLREMDDEDEFVDASEGREDEEREKEETRAGEHEEGEDEGEADNEEDDFGGFGDFDEDDEYEDHDEYDPEAEEKAQQMHSHPSTLTEQLSIDVDVPRIVPPSRFFQADQRNSSTSKARRANKSDKKHSSS